MDADRPELSVSPLADSPLAEGPAIVAPTRGPAENAPDGYVSEYPTLGVRLKPLEIEPSEAIGRRVTKLPDLTEQVTGEAGASLLLPEQLPRRSIELERIARQADRQTRRGFELAGRQALFAARSEFTKALRLLTQGLDAERQTTRYSQALSAGLTAIKEADDFIPDGSRLEADLDLPTIIDGHRTPVFKDAAVENLSPLSALKGYFTYAQEQLALAAGHEVAGSMALHALGKVHAKMAVQHVDTVRAAESKAVVFFQAALLTYPRNQMAANDLGVLLARGENYEEALVVLKHSLSIHQQASGWRNLAAVYRRLGRMEMARRADRLAETTRQAELGRKQALKISGNGMVRWLDPHEFARTKAKTPDFQTPPRTPAAEPAGARPASPPLTGWRMPWSRSKKQ